MQPLQSTQDGLTECIGLLNPQEHGNTLPLSSTRSEVLKGFAVRMGEKITKGELVVRLLGLGNVKKGHTISISNEGIILEQVPAHGSMKDYIYLGHRCTKSYCGCVKFVRYPFER